MILPACPKQQRGKKHIVIEREETGDVVAARPSQRAAALRTTQQLAAQNSELAGWRSTSPAGIFLISKFLLTPY